MKKINCYLLLFMLVMCSFSNLEAKAAEKDKSLKNVQMNVIGERGPLLFSCALELGIGKDGMILSITTFSDEIAEEIGCENVILQEKQLLGSKDIKVNTSPRADANFYLGEAVYSNAIPGKSYRLKGTHYAIIDGVKYTVDNISNWVVFD